METTEEGDNEETAVSELRSELWLKERELTDIRLEALSSAHQLEQLRETMNSMQVSLLHTPAVLLLLLFQCCVITLHIEHIRNLI